MVSTPLCVTSRPVSAEDAEFLCALANDTEGAPWKIMSGSPRGSQHCYCERTS
jgi:hypothetical protein